MQSCCPSRSTRGSAVETPPVTCRWRAISGQRRVFASFLDGGWRNGKRGAWSLARDRGRQRSRRVTCAQGGGGSEVAGAVHYVPHRAQKSTPNGISGPPPPQGKRWEGYPELFGVSLLYGEAGCIDSWSSTGRACRCLTRPLLLLQAATALL